jgi:hypothetical protein
MSYDEKVLNIYWYFFQFILYITYILIVLYIIGVYKGDPTEYLKKVDNYAKIIVSLFLMWKFNFLRSKIKFKDLDRVIVFQSGLFLFLTTSVDVILINYFNKLKTKIIPSKTTNKKNK